MKTCGQCYFYEQMGTGKNGKGEDVEVGTCFGAPPTARPDNSAYPVVGKITRHCGAFRPAPTKRKATK